MNFQNGALDETYWRVYNSVELTYAAEKVRQCASIDSTRVKIHLDIYQRPERDAPIVICNHGIAGYCRLLVPVAMGFYERGYTAILPDQKGQGYSGGPRGDYTIAECVQNILDVAAWAKQHFNASRIYLAGVSAGGGLTYYAAAHMPVNAIACLDLFEFTLDNLMKLVPNAVLVKLLSKLLPVLPLVAPLRIPLGVFIGDNNPADTPSRDWQTKWETDPVVLHQLTLRALASHVTTPSPLPFESNRTPILVLNQGNDSVVNPSLTHLNYARLSGAKHYVELTEYGHWANQPAFWNTILDACDTWFQQYRV
jgi:alpha-beta hydrolase superfamily lysophospholipase